MDEGHEDQLYSAILENTIDVDMENEIRMGALDDSEIDIVGLSPQKDTFGSSNATRAESCKVTVRGFQKDDQNVMSCCICNKLFVLFPILLCVCLRPLAVCIMSLCVQCSDVFSIYLINHRRTGIIVTSLGTGMD